MTYDKDGQQWEIGEEDSLGYFTIKNLETQQYLVATTEGDMTEETIMSISSVVGYARFLTPTFPTYFVVG